MPRTGPNPTLHSFCRFCQVAYPGTRNIAQETPGSRNRTQEAPGNRDRAEEAPGTRNRTQEAPETSPSPAKPSPAQARPDSAHENDLFYRWFWRPPKSRPGGPRNPKSKPGGSRMIKNKGKPTPRDQKRFNTKQPFPRYCHQIWAKIDPKKDPRIRTQDPQEFQY